MTTFWKFITYIIKRIIKTMNTILLRHTINPPRDDITLSTGAIVKCVRMPNGSQDCNIDDRDMTNEEWIEFCAIIRGQSK